MNREAQACWGGSYEFASQAAPHNIYPWWSPLPAAKALTEG